MYPEQENIEPTEHEHVLGPNDPEPVVIAPFHFALLFLATFGLYSIWWQYKCWKYINRKAEFDILSLLKAILFLFFGIELFNKIATYCREYNHRVRYNSIALWAMVILINLSSRLPEPYFWGSLLAFVPFLFPVTGFNFYFTGNKNGYKDDKLNDKQIFLLLAGGAFWMLVIAALVMNHGSLKTT